MSNITLRSVKGSPLTNTEVDDNFSNLDSDKVELTAPTGSIKVPVGTTAQRDGTPSNGYFRYNSSLNAFEGYINGTWGELGAVDSADVSNIIIADVDKAFVDALNVDADTLDNQDGAYYLDWTNVTNKPDPVITLAGDLTGSATLTDVGSATLTATIVDKYTSWSFSATDTQAISSGETVTFVGTGDATVTNSGNTITIDVAGGGDTYSLTAIQSGGTNTDPFIFLDAGTGTDTTVLLKGTGATSVTRDSDGSITFNSTDTTTNETITLSGDVTGSGTTSITASLAANTVTSSELSGAVTLIIYDSAGSAVKTLYGAGS